MAGRALLTNLAATTLSSGISDSATSIPVTDGSVFPSPTGDDYAYLTIEFGADVEIVKLTARSGNTLTVERGQDGTSGTAFSSGADIALRLPKIIIDEIHTKIDGHLAVEVKTANFTAVPGVMYALDASGGAFTMTLPASPSAGDTVYFTALSDMDTYQVTFDRNGEDMEGGTSNYDLDAQKSGGWTFTTEWKAFQL
jgi:hypothetical protein